MVDMLGEFCSRCLPQFVSFPTNRITDNKTIRSPGRFLVEQMLKMSFAHMLTMYDIEYLPEMPKNFVLGPINVPPPSLTIRIRRRGVA